MSDALQDAIIKVARDIEWGLGDAMARQKLSGEVHLFGPDEGTDGYSHYYSSRVGAPSSDEPVTDLEPFLDAAPPPSTIAYNGGSVNLPALVIVFEDGVPVLDQDRTAHLQQIYAERIVKLLET